MTGAPTLRYNAPGPSNFIFAMAIVTAEAKAAYLDLDNAAEVEDKLTRALDAVQAHSDRLKEKTEGSGVHLL